MLESCRLESCRVRRIVSRRKKRVPKYGTRARVSPWIPLCLDTLRPWFKIRKIRDARRWRFATISTESPLDVVRFIWRIRVFCRGGLIGGSRRVDGDTRAEEKGWGGDGVRNGLCGCRWTTALIAPPRLMPRNVHKCSPDSTWYRDSHALAPFIHLWRPLLGHLPLFFGSRDHDTPIKRRVKGWSN